MMSKKQEIVKKPERGGGGGGGLTSRNKKDTGVTLVALVITIIILLILAGITISALTGENGLFKRAVDARDNTLLAQQEEQNVLNYLEENMDDWINGTGGGGSTPQQRVEAEGWNTAIIADVVNGAPIPVGFTVDPGNQEVSSGLVIRDAIGNEFVWIPCTPAQYIKWDGSVTSDGHANMTDDAIPGAVTGWGQNETSQITEYKGFYIARYEAGMPTSFIVNPANDTNRNLPGIPLSQKNQIPWNYINSINAKANAESMINESNVQSGLVTGRMWDRTMKWLEDAGENVQTDSTAWGNYNNALVTGVTEYSTDFGATWTTVGVSTKGTSIDWLLKTGHSEYTKRKNIYDLAGNLCEVTNEICISTYRGYRGGCYGDNGTICPASYRDGSVGGDNPVLTFRVRTVYQVKTLFFTKYNREMYIWLS